MLAFLYSFVFSFGFYFCQFFFFFFHFHFFSVLLLVSPCAFSRKTTGSHARVQEWTRELCQKDSDGDGRTNGEELGDPNCVWRVGDIPTSSTGLSHPGQSDRLLLLLFVQYMGGDTFDESA